MDFVSSEWTFSVSDILNKNIKPAPREEKKDFSVQKKREEFQSHELTAANKAEVQALAMKPYLTSKSFQKKTDSRLIKYVMNRKTSSKSKAVTPPFQVGVMFGSDRIAAGAGKESQSAGTTNTTKMRGKSILSEALKSEEIQEWTKKRFMINSQRREKDREIMRKERTKNFHKKRPVKK
jgi:Fcf2 pre-rRNA processing